MKSAASSPVSVQLPAAPPGLRAMLASVSLAALEPSLWGRLLAGVPEHVKVASNAACVVLLYA